MKLFSKDWRSRLLEAISIPSPRSRRKHEPSVAPSIASPSHSKEKKNLKNYNFSRVLADTDVGNYEIENCCYDVENADLFLRVANSLFPVHRSKIALSSPILRTILVSIGYHDENATIVSFGDLDIHKMKRLLSYIYFPNRKINGEYTTCYS